MARSRNYPMLQKSPSGLCEIEICNYRIGAPVLLNRCCAFQPDLESIFLAEMLKILLQHNLPRGDLSALAGRRRSMKVRGFGRQQSTTDCVGGTAARRLLVGAHER